METPVQELETERSIPSDPHRSTPPAHRHPRRRALHALLVAAGAASALLPSLLLEASARQAPICPGSGPDLVRVNEIKSQDGKLQAVIKAVSGKREVATKAGAPPTVSMLRYFEGYNPADPDDPAQKWPVSATAGPGPTLRAEIGDVVQITLLNQVKVQDFGGSLDAGEEGRGNGCDQATKANPDGTTDKNWYPHKDKFPNCFHSSSTANIHFHGTHVTPSTTGDNVLVAVRPNQKVTERDVRASFEQIFQHCELGQQPRQWSDLPQGWRSFQETLLKEYDATAPYVGPGRSPSGHGLPHDLQLWPQNQQAIAQGVWPQWFSGSYPYCYQIPKYTVDRNGRSNVWMGQAPGTHWYHSHKHGSTSLNLYNGLAGAFIIADDGPQGYDGRLRAFYDDKLDQKVLVIQELTTVLNLLSVKDPGPPPLLVNGQLTPTITMKPGQVQLWRMINASVQGFVNAKFDPASQPGIQFRQTAQDGVQYAWENFAKKENGTQAIALAPANRVDLLVQAPTAPGCYTLKDARRGTLVYVTVTGESVSMGFPTKATDFPKRPDFLDTIEPATIHLRRELTYGSSRDAQNPSDRRAWQFTIDGKQFEDQVINQVMLLDSAEEWTVYNSDVNTQIRHPFHIHINPFQIVEVFDPTIDITAPQVLKPPYIWWDTFAIPPPAKLSPGQSCPSKVVDDGKDKWCSGYFKMRSRFADFTGQYVQHCHLLAHEDRGMMQLLEVVTDKTVLKHH